MKKFVLLFCVFIFVAAAAYFIPVTQNHNVIIKSNFDNVLSSLKVPENWEKWHPLVKDLWSENRGTPRLSLDSSHRRYKFSNGTDSIVVEIINPVLYDLREYGKNNFSSYAFEIIPSANATNFVTVRVIEKTPLLLSLLPFLKTSAGQRASSNLKNYLEDVSAFYGYDIKVEKVVDTVFATEMITIPETELFKMLPQEFEKIKSFIEQNALAQTNFNSVSYLSKGDSTALILGIPVNKFVQTNSKIACVNIPKGRMLTAIYQGKFCDRKKIYTAFKNYARDNLMENVGAAFESYIDNQLPSSDTSIVKFKLYYPIL